MPPNHRQRRFMQFLVVFGAITFFARCFDQAKPYWKVISGKKDAPADTRDPLKR